MQGNPNIAENLSKIQTERSNLQNLLSKTLRELRENSFSTLTTTVEVSAHAACNPSSRPIAQWVVVAQRLRRRRRRATT